VAFFISELNFKEPIMQKFTGMQYLQIDIASNYGLDKKTWDERLAWFKAHEDCLMEMLATAETPALYYAGVKAYEAALAGQASGYPVSLDATASGLQILAALTGDRSAAELCNVVSTGYRADAYTGVYDRMLVKIGEEGKIKRTDVKQAVMTALYGSKAVPKEVFGEGVLLAMFYDTMQEVAPAAWELNEAFLDMWNPEALCNSWVLPDNFHVHVKVMSQVKETVHFLNEPFDTFRTVNAPVDEGRSLGANTIHSLDGMIVREMNRRCNYDRNVVDRVYAALDGEGNAGLDEDDAMVMTLWAHYKESGYLSARILDHLFHDNIDLVDIATIRELLNSLPQTPFQIMTIHDCFRCLPNYGNDLREQYNLQLQLIAKSDLLQFLIRQLLQRQVNISKLDPDLWKDIDQAEYALS
jgi:hypothetical protein